MRPLVLLLAVVFCVSFISAYTHSLPIPPPARFQLRLEKAFPWTFNGPVDLRYSFPKKSSSDIESDGEDIASYYQEQDQDDREREELESLVDTEDDEELIYVAERSGKIWVFPNCKDKKDEENNDCGDDEFMKNKKKIFLDLSDRLTIEGEMGLLGFVFHPDFPKNPHVYVSYVRRDDKKEETDAEDEDEEVLSGVEFEEVEEEEEERMSSEDEPDIDTKDGDVDLEILRNLRKGKKILHTISKFKVKHRREADKSSEKVLMNMYKPSILHQGGQVFFGAQDRCLYIALGDGKRPKEAQNPNSYLGKILRLDVDLKQRDEAEMLGMGIVGEEEPEEEDVYYSQEEEEELNGRFYGIPKGNPFAKGGGYPEIFALGFRNPWRCSSDLKGKGDEKQQVWCGDIGKNSWEEINLVKEGKNYGWPWMEGFWCWVDVHCNEHDLFQLPFYAYPHPDILDRNRDDADDLSQEEKEMDNSNSKLPYFPPVKYHFPFNGSAVVGGYIYEGDRVPWLKGAFVFGDYVGKKLGAFFYDGDRIKRVTEIVSQEEFDKGPIAFGVDSHNEFYILTQGRNRYIYKFESWPEDEMLNE